MTKNADQAVLEFTAGRLLGRVIRDFLKGCEFKGMRIDWREGSGLIERDWIVKGSEADIEHIAASLRDWAVRLRSAHQRTDAPPAR